MNPQELRQAADRAEAGTMTEQEKLQIVVDIIKMSASQQEESAKLVADAKRLTDIYDRRFPELLERAQSAEAVAGCLFALLLDFMPKSDIEEAVERMAEEHDKVQQVQQ